MFIFLSSFQSLQINLFQIPIIMHCNFSEFIAIIWCKCYWPKRMDTIRYFVLCKFSLFSAAKLQLAKIRLFSWKTFKLCMIRNSVIILLADHHLPLCMYWMWLAYAIAIWKFCTFASFLSSTIQIGCHMKLVGLHHW